jgi:hypothetical protein
MWVTKDGRIRHELLPNGRFAEARGSRKSAYQGRYWLEGDHIEYVDDTGFTATVISGTGPLSSRNDSLPGRQEIATPPTHILTTKTHSTS